MLVVKLNSCLLFSIVDVTCFHNGYHGDLNETLFVGKVDEESKNLVQTAYDSLMAAINEGKCNIYISLSILHVLWNIIYQRG